LVCVLYIQFLVYQLVKKISLSIFIIKGLFNGLKGLDYDFID
jgi:hypothetical protein